MASLTRLIGVLLITAIALFLMLAAKPGAAPAPALARKAVIVELFTSEGCSSCPPADELLGRLRQEGPDGVEVVTLGFHVDYWNYLGWQDRFSAAAYSKRQETYAQLFRTEGPYTPQMIVDGEEEFVGSDASRARRAIAQAAAQPAAANIDLSWAATDKLLVRVNAHDLNSGDVFVAITEDNLSSRINAGENNGHTLHHSAVVREFRRIGQLQKGNFEAGVPFKFDQGWKRGDLRVVVLVQTGRDGKIQGLASAAPK